MTMLTKYSDTMLTPYFNLFDYKPFKFADEIFYGDRHSMYDHSYRVDTTDTGLTLSIDLPGVKSKDVSVQVTGRVVTVSGKLRGQDFKMSYSISRDYDADTADATLEDGVLAVTFDKTSKVNSKTIQVKVK